MLLTDRIILITGAARGIGAAIAEVCLREGALVYCADREYAGIRQAGERFWELPCDVSCDEDLRRCVAAMPRLDGLVNNAGVNFLKPFLETTLEDYDRVLNIDLRAVFRLTQLAARAMSDGGSIVNISSVHSLAGVPGAAPYDAAKAGVIGLTKSLAVELAPMNIRVNAISPGLIETQIWRDVLAAAADPRRYEEYWHSNIPQARLIQPAEIAELAAFLLSERASCITGANITADAGMTAQLVSREPRF
jgi:NAD(P)-dependent dehydrogenase (short-subunit alcohol dehydrogenase family)